MSSPRSLSVGLVAGLAALTLVSCGGRLDPQPLNNTEAELLVTKREIAQKPANSPQRVLFEWWRSIQFNDFEGYNAALSSTALTSAGAKAAARDLLRLSPALRYEKPDVLERVAVGPSRATLYTRIEVRTPIGRTDFVTSYYPQAFPMVNEGGAWKLASTNFVESLLRASSPRNAE